MYRSELARRLVNRNPKLAKLYIERVNGNTTVANLEETLQQIFLEKIVHDPILLAEYRDIIATDKPDHIVIETATTKNIKSLINIYGWEEFVNGFILLAKNKQTNLKKMGITENQWEKIVRHLSALPKHPQF